MPDRGSSSEPAVPTLREADEARPCRRCGYDLEGQRPREGVITCPECGLSGTWREVMRDEDRPGWTHRILTMSGPCIACLVLAVVISLIGHFSRISWLDGLALAVAIVGLFSGLILPPWVAGTMMERELTPEAKFWFFMSGIAAGWGINILAVIVIWMTVVIVFG